jgi:hypothetical protein
MSAVKADLRPVKWKNDNNRESEQAQIQDYCSRRENMETKETLKTLFSGLDANQLSQWCLFHWRVCEQYQTRGDWCLCADKIGLHGTQISKLIS